MKLGVTHQVIVNDQHGAVLRAVNRISVRIPKVVDNDVFAYLHSNPTLADGLPLFDAAHGNLAPAALLSEDALSAGRVLLALQKELGGEECEADDAYLLHTIQDRTLAEKLLQGVTLSNDTRKPVFNYLMPFWSSKISGAFYQFADPQEFPVIGFSFLSGQEAPYVETHMDFGTRALEIAIVHTYGYGAIGHVGAVKTPAP